MNWICKRGKRSTTPGSTTEGRAQKMTSKRTAEVEAATVVEDCNGGPSVRVSKFDYSVENHLNAVDRISELCGEAVEDNALDQSEIQRFSSLVTFLRQITLSSSSITMFARLRASSPSSLSFTFNKNYRHNKN